MGLCNSCARGRGPFSELQNEVEEEGVPDPFSELQNEIEEEGVPHPFSELPNDVVAKIQAQLPLVSLVRSRAVCRAWKAAAESRALLQERLETGAGARDSMLFVVGLRHSDGKGKTSLASCAYDSASDRWYQLQLPPWLRTLPDFSPVRPEVESMDLSSTWAGGGVLVFVLQPHPERAPEQTVMAHIGNPMADSWASLPLFPKTLRFWRVLGLFVDAVAKCFKLVGVEYRTSPARTFVFDSALGTWSVITSVLPYHGRGVGQGVFVGTVLYCFTANHNLLAYDLERASWSLLDVYVPRPTRLILYSNLVNLRDRLLCAALVSFLGKGEEDKWSLQIWEMDFVRMAWTEVDAMPALMLTQFWGDGSCGHLKLLPPVLDAVAGQDEVMYIALFLEPMIAALDLRHTPGAGAWRWLPSMPHSIVRRRFYCLNPSLKFGDWMQD